MEKDDQAGAKAAIQHFFDLRAYAFNTGQTAPLRAMSSDECKFCSSAIKTAKERRDDGQHYVGHKVTVTSAALEGTRTDGVLTFSVEASQAPWRLVDESGDVVKRNSETVLFEALIGVYRAGSAWRVRAVTVTETA